MVQQPSLLDHDLRQLKRLLNEVDTSKRGVIEAQAALTRASIQEQSTQYALNSFMQHLGVEYGLKPQDGISFDGSISFLDPGWAQEAAVQAQPQAQATFYETQCPENPDAEVSQEVDPPRWLKALPTPEFH